MNQATNQSINQPLTRASVVKTILTAIFVVLAGGIIGMVTHVIARALLEIQQQLGSGAAPGLLALVGRLLLTSLRLLAGAADAVTQGAGVGGGAGLAAALAYLAYHGLGRGQVTSAILPLVLAAAAAVGAGLGGLWFGVAAQTWAVLAGALFGLLAGLALLLIEGRRTTRTMRQTMVASLLALLLIGLIGGWSTSDWSISLPTASASPAPQSAVIGQQNASQVVELAQIDIEAEQAIYTPDGQQLILATAQGATFFDLATQQQRHTVGNDPITQVAISPDGQTLATVGQNSIQLWQTNDGRLLHTLREHRGVVTDVAFSPDGHILASAARDRTARLWQVRNGSQLYRLPHVGDLYSLAFTADGRTLVTGSSLGTTLWEVATGGRLQLVDVALSAATAVQFSPAGSQLALGLDNGSLRLGPIENYGKAVALDGHTGSINQLAFHPTGTLLASAGADHKVYLWATADGAQVAALPGHVNQVVSVAFSPDGRTLATVGWDSTVRIRGIQGGALTAGSIPSPLPTATQQPAAVVADAPISAATVAELSQQPLLNRKDVVDLAYSPDGRWLAVAGETVVIYERATLTSQREIKAKAARVRFSPNGETLATVEGKVVKLWAVIDGALTHQFDIHTDTVEEIAFSPDGTLLATAARDKQVRLFQVESEQLVRQVGHFGQVRSVAFSPDGATLATGSTVGAVLWRVNDGARLRILSVGLRAVNRVAFSPDGETLAAAFDNGTITLWQQGGRGESVDLTRHSGPVLALVFSPDGALLASAGADGTVRLWNAEGAPLRLLADYTGLATSLHFQPDGQALAVVTTAEGVKLWRDN